MTRVMLNYEYDSKLEGDQFRTRLSAIEAYAVFLPKDSWWRAQKSESLLDHEQGHFDIAELAARRLQHAFNKTLQAGIGSTQQDAIRAMEAKLSKILQLVNEQAVNENAEYDRITSHGSNRRAQIEQRRIQRLSLRRLEKELKKQSSLLQAGNIPPVGANED